MSLCLHIPVTFFKCIVPYDIRSNDLHIGDRVIQVFL